MDGAQVGKTLQLPGWEPNTLEAGSDTGRLVYEDEAADDERGKCPGLAPRTLNGCTRAIHGTDIFINPAQTDVYVIVEDSKDNNNIYFGNTRKANSKYSLIKLPIQ